MKILAILAVLLLSVFVVEASRNQRRILQTALKKQEALAKELLAYSEKQKMAYWAYIKSRLQVASHPHHLHAVASLWHLLLEGIRSDLSEELTRDFFNQKSREVQILRSCTVPNKQILDILEKSDWRLEANYQRSLQPLNNFDYDNDDVSICK